MIILTNLSGWIYFRMNWREILIVSERKMFCHVNFRMQFIQFSIVPLTTYQSKYIASKPHKHEVMQILCSWYNNNQESLVAPYCAEEIWAESRRSLINARQRQNVAGTQLDFCPYIQMTSHWLHIILIQMTKDTFCDINIRKDYNINGN